MFKQHKCFIFVSQAAACSSLHSYNPQNSVTYFPFPSFFFGRTVVFLFYIDHTKHSLNTRRPQSDEGSGWQLNDGRCSVIGFFWWRERWNWWVVKVVTKWLSVGGKSSRVQWKSTRKHTHTHTQMFCHLNQGWRPEEQIRVPTLKIMQIMTTSAYTCEIRIQRVGIYCRLFIYFM